MVKLENQFVNMSDSTLKIALAEYETWRDNCFIPENGPLAAARDKYCQIYDAPGLFLMERDLLNAAAKRWPQTWDNK